MNQSGLIISGQVSKIGERFHVSSELKLNEGMTLLLKLALLFGIRKRFF